MKPSAHLRTVLAAGLLLFLGGCVIPKDLPSTLLTRYQRELVRRGPQDRHSEGLGLLQPACGTTGPAFVVYADPAGGPQQVYLGLDQAIMRTLANNPEIRTVSYEPAIAREAAIQAAAAFDITVFGGISNERSDTQTVGFSPTQPFESLSRTVTYQAGLREKTITGAQVEMSWTLQHLRDNALLVGSSNRYDNTLGVQLTQPLLRNAGPAVNLAQLRVARIRQQSSLADFRDNVDRIVTEVIDNYWNLAQAREDLEIQQRLLDETQRTLQRVEARAELDATSVEINQIRSAYESRHASLIGARKTVFDVQDELVRRMADAQLNLLGEFEVIPTTPMAYESVSIDLSDRLMTALAHNPVLEQVRLAIAQADIAVMVARNQALPRLDLVASGSLQGLDRRADEAARTSFGGDYASYGIGLQGEYPLGNRERRSQLRQTRLQRAQAITALQNRADELAVALLERARQVQTSYEEYQAQDRAVQAALEQLRALDDLERIRARLTPEFLQVKLSAQEAASNAARSRLRAQVQYNQALADLDRVSGTVLTTHRVELALPVAIGDAVWPSPAEAPLPLRPQTAPAETQLGPATQPVSATTTKSSGISAFPVDAGPGSP